MRFRSTPAIRSIFATPFSRRASVATVTPALLLGGAAGVSASTHGGVMEGAVVGSVRSDVAVIAPPAKAEVAHPQVLAFRAVPKPKPAPVVAEPESAPATSDADALASDRTESGASRSSTRTAPVSGSGLAGLTPTSRALMNAVVAEFSEITNVGGVRPDSLPDHPSGRAVDFMIPDYWNNQDLGDAVAAYVIANASEFNVEYIIWRQRIWQGGGWQSMSDRGSATANHMDHVHVTVR